MIHVSPPSRAARRRQALTWVKPGSGGYRAARAACPVKGGVTMPAFPGQDEILVALPLRQRPGLYIGPDAGKGGALVILEEPAGEEDYGADAIIGLAVPRQGGGWYLGCVECRDEVPEEDSGMCQRCRE